MMSDRKCPFYVYESTGWFSYKETCKANDREISSTTFNTYCNNYESGYSKCPNYKPEKDSGGCFITSACVEARGLGDCCHELTLLRSFRDEWLAEQPDGKADIDEYYRMAPVIVDRIHASDDSMDVLNGLYESLVVPCIKLIEDGRNHEAWILYKNTYMEIKAKYDFE